MRWALVAGALSLLVLQTRAVLSGRAELLRAERATDEANRVMHLRRAARWRAPLSPYPARALDRLREIARRQGDPALALRAWEGIRGALLGTRVLGVPFPPRLREANENIAALRGGARSSDAYRRQLAALERPRGTAPAATILALVGLAAWVTGGFCMPGRRRLGRVLLIVGLPLFAAGVWLA